MSLPIDILVNISSYLHNSLYLNLQLYNEIEKEECMINWKNKYFEIIKPYEKQMNLNIINFKNWKQEYVRLLDTDLSHYIDDLTKVDPFIVNFCEITKYIDKVNYIPVELYFWNQLTSLSLVDCKIKRINREIINLKNLYTLDLSKNKINVIEERLPISIKILYLCQNNIIKFPDFSYLSLKTLDLSDNLIKNVPLWIAKMKELKFLYLYNNRIERITKKIFKNKDIMQNIYYQYVINYNTDYKEFICIDFDYNYKITVDYTSIMINSYNKSYFFDSFVKIYKIKYDSFIFIQLNENEFVFIDSGINKININDKIQCIRSSYIGLIYAIGEKNIYLLNDKKYFDKILFKEGTEPYDNEFLKNIGVKDLDVTQIY